MLDFIVSIEPKLSKNTDISANLEEGTTYQSSRAIVGSVVRELIEISTKPNENKYNCKTLSILASVIK